MRSPATSVGDKPPLIFAPRLGGLFPANSYAREMMKSLIGECLVEIKRSGANQRRRGFYWVMLDVAAEALADATSDPWDQELLHEELKRRLNLGEWFTTPSGVEVFKPRSTSNRAMEEPDRSRWVDRCSTTLAQWLGVPMKDLMDEVRSREGDA